MIRLSQLPRFSFRTSQLKLKFQSSFMMVLEKGGSGWRPESLPSEQKDDLEKIATRLNVDPKDIEHVWDKMGVIIRDMDNSPTNLAQLRDAVVRAWAQIPMDYIAHLVATMPNRVAALEVAYGGNATY